MTSSIEQTIELPQARAQVWRALTDPEALSRWMYPNDFEPKVGHRFTFNVPANPKANFDGTVRCEVLECTEPAALSYSWEGGDVVGTRVDFTLEADDSGGTRLRLEHGGFDLDQPWGEQALTGAEYGWDMMLTRLASVAGDTAPSD